MTTLGVFFGKIRIRLVVDARISWVGILFLTAARKREKRVRMKFKLIRCSVCAFALLASAVLFVTGCNNKDAELAVQSQKELETVRAELEQTRTSAAAQEAELTRLRKEKEELLRLRNETRQLREEKQQLAKQLESLQATTAGVQQQARQLQKLQVENQQLQQSARRIKQNADLNICINNLRQVGGAKQQWALANQRASTTIPTAQDVAAFMKDGFTECPAGGTYTLNAVGASPTCSISNHALPQ
jgi:alanyl-tRNA synthetase